MSQQRDRLLTGPLSQPDLADGTTRAAYVEAVDGPGDLADYAEESDDRGGEVEGVVGLEGVSPRSGLLDYQAELVESIVGLLKRPAPANIGLVALPTGAGKTRTAVCAVLELLSARSLSTALWLAPSRELLEQAVGTFRQLWPTVGTNPGGLDLLRCQILKGYPHPKRASVYLSTPQMLYQRLKRERTKLPPWGLIIFDEAHLAEAPTFRDALTLARELGGIEAPCLGLSATPGRSDESETTSLIGLFQRRLLTSRLLGRDAFKALRNRGVLARVDFKAIRVEHRTARSAKDAITDISRFRAVVDLCQTLACAGSTMVFSGSIRHAAALALALKYRGVGAAWVSGTMSSRERERTLRAFEAGAISVIVNKSLLATGYDCPAINNVVLTVPIRSALLFEQMVGRASRGPRVGGNARATVWHFEDHIKWHGEPSSYQRYALSGWH